MVRGLQALKDATVITYIRLRAEQPWFDSQQKQTFLCRFAHTKPESAKFTFDKCHVRTSQKEIPFCPVFTISLNGLQPNQTTIIIQFNQVYLHAESTARRPITETAPTTYNIHKVHLEGPIAVAARSKARVLGRSLARILGTNPAEGRDLCLLLVMCVVV